MGCQATEKLFFIDSKNTHYGKLLIEDPALAFATAWHEEGNHINRKGIQGVGSATLTTDASEIETGVSLHNVKYPEFADHITPDWVQNNEKGSGVWVIRPTFIKFWNDELYGLDGSKEFNFYNLFTCCEL